jgi:general secretion pathway protein G
MDNGQRTTDHGRKGGFTLVELLVVIIVLAILIALLLPAINGAVRTSKEAAVSAEINLLGQALESFKAKYGSYPPSRFLAVENGHYDVFLGDTTTLNGGTLTDPTSPGAGDITLGQLAQRSVQALRTCFPRVGTTGPPLSGWYDYNGNGNIDPPYILHGHECLVFFLGGVPLLDSSSQTYTMTGFGKDPTNPFTNSIVGSAAYNNNRQPPLFEFTSGRLFLDPHGNSGIPGYYDSLNNSVPGSGTTLNFYAYFNAYGGARYDPNDVNFISEQDNNNPTGPIGLLCLVGFPTIPPTPTLTPPPCAASPAPNPYTATTTWTTSGTVAFQKPQTYQIISPGLDGLYGVGGQYVSNSQSSSSATALPLDTTTQQTQGTSPYLNTADASIRQREYDNLTNFTSRRLQ